jgi:glycosyltransferase involved in cell wall biosynthesis
MNDDVTVVIACFNYGAYVAESVASALAQTGGAPRLIVVDDGSTDPETLAALDRLPPQVDIVRQSNVGVAAARNAGLRRADTRYALVLDADDLLARDALQRLREPLETDPQLAYSYGVMRFFGAWEGELKLPPFDPYGLLYRHSVGSAALMRRELLDEVGGFDPAFAGYEDWEFWLHALARGFRGRRVEAVTLMYRRHANTRHLAARPRYRRTFRQLRRKHASLYTRAGRRRLGRDSNLSGAARLVYRVWWGQRPLPARVELTLQSILWRPRRRSRRTRPRS